MKIRVGFVSNSSSSSFLIAGLGARFSVADYEEFLEKYNYSDEGDSPGFLTDPEDEWSGEPEVQIGEFNLTVGEYSGIFYIYKAYSKLDENKTIAQSKEEIANSIKDIIGKLPVVRNITESWEREY